MNHLIITDPDGYIEFEIDFRGQEYKDRRVSLLEKRYPVSDFRYIWE